MTLPVHDGLLQIFDVEHGACALLTVASPDGTFRRLLIDCGHNASTRWTPGAHLKSLGVAQIEQLVITNYDEDHVSGYRSLTDHGVGYGWILRNPSVLPQTIRHLKSETGMGPGIDALVRDLGHCGAPAAGVNPPSFQGVAIEWFYNVYPRFDDENNLSLVVNLRVHGWSFLFPGDMECAGFNHLLEVLPRFREVVQGVHVLVASHHGRANGICPAMFDQWGCRPQLVAISDDYKQYDTQETAGFYSRHCAGIANFRGAGKHRKILTTRNDGEIRFSFQAGSCRVS